MLYENNLYATGGKGEIGLKSTIFTVDRGFTRENIIDIINRAGISSMMVITDNISDFQLFIAESTVEQTEG